MGVRPEGTTLDRIDGKKNYTPANCRWATQKDQMRNTSRALKYQGKSLKEWSDETGIKYDTLRYRLQKHGTIYL
jgi:sugar diacid utilization regulator